MSYEFIAVERKGRNALAALDADEGVGAIVLTGNEKAFAAGADIAAMKNCAMSATSLRLRVNP